MRRKGGPRRACRSGFASAPGRRASTSSASVSGTPGISGIRATPPVPFATRPISYDVAFGGADTRHEDPDQTRLVRGESGGPRISPAPEERVGRWHAAARHRGTRPAGDAPGRRLRADGVRVDRSRMGSVARSFAGTYDQKWLDDHFPFLPPDFDERYYQAAPRGSAAAHCRSVRQQVVLANLTPDGRRVFDLPSFKAPVHVFPKNDEREDYTASLDTIVLEPDLERFTMTLACRPAAQAQHLRDRAGARRHEGARMVAAARGGRVPDRRCGACRGRGATVVTHAPNTARAAAIRDEHGR